MRVGGVRVIATRKRARFESARVRAIAAAWLVALCPAAALADTLPGALIQAYQNNPQLNAQRAAARASDENVPQALSGYRPRVSLSASVASNYLDSLVRNPGTAPCPGPPGGSPTATGCGTTYSHISGNTAVQTYGATITQTLMNGFQTANRTRQAESIVSASRETLRLTEQNVLLAAATAYMNLLRDIAIQELQQRNVEVLQEQLRQTRDRFNVGEVTRTDVAQSESRLAAGRSQLLQAISNVTTSRATYRQVIGVEPGTLAPGTPVDRLSPKTLPQAVTQARAIHPSVTTSMFNVDSAVLQVKIAEGALYPTLNLVGTAQKSYGSTTSLNALETFTGTIGGQLSVPVYQGGSEYATIRQAKETLTQRRIDLDDSRDQVQQNVVQSWGQLDAAKAQIIATQAQVTASEIALNGVREEARVGQRTTLDVLNAQQELVNARVALVSAQRDRVVASYTLLAAVGGLTVQRLSLKVPVYDPRIHYYQVRDSWFGLRTPDGK
jgi:outer membrane protein